MNRNNNQNNNNSSKEFLEMQGEVIELLPAANFKSKIRKWA